MLRIVETQGCFPIRAEVVQPVRVMVQVAPDTARQLRGQVSESPAARQLLGQVARLGIALRLLRARRGDSPLAGGFTVEVADRSTAERVIRALRRCDAVEAAYYAPP